MSNPGLKFWNKKHFEKNELTRMSRHSTFVEQSIKYFNKGGRILELGTGMGSDTLFLAGQGFKIVATDFSQPALDKLKEKTSDNAHIETKQFDLSDQFPFEDQSFNAVYTHLTLHYFNRRITQQIYDEIYRVLKPEGVVAVLLNSVADSEYGAGEKIEDDYFDVPDKGPKRYFSMDSLQPFVRRFETIILDNKGSDPRRNHKENLIRFIGRKTS